MMVNNSRNYALDLLRVFSCYLVIQIHAGEFYYIGEGGSVITGDNTYWEGIINSIGRTAVPLFIMVSGYFLLPLKDTTSVFFRKRFTRILYPFIVWCVVYAVYNFLMKGESWQQMCLNILQIPVNFGTQVGHLWYIYALIGLYVLIPILSPWLKSCSKTELQAYLAIWIFTTFVPYIHEIFPEILGECYWNPSPALYYFTGFAGYLILGYYIKKYVSSSSSIVKPLLLLVIGYAITAYVFCSRIDTSAIVTELELSWGYCTFNVVMMSLGLFLLFKAIPAKGNSRIGGLFTDIAAKSYGMYLAHIIVLNFYYSLLNDLTDSALIKIPLIAICTFITTYVVVRIIAMLPKSKYLVG